ncbi:hypothetical protein [Archaeoglobus sp.]
MGRDIVGYLLAEGEDITDPVTVNISVEKTSEITGNCLILKYEGTELIFDVREFLKAVLDELLEGRRC